MENKVQKVGVNFSNKLLTYFFSLILVVYYIYGFYIDENSAGAGGYTGDFEIIWGNLLLLQDDIFLILIAYLIEIVGLPLLIFCIYCLILSFIVRKHSE